MCSSDLISGQVKKSEASANSGIKNLRQFGVQELDIIPIIKSITKYAVTINRPEKIRYELEKAVHIANTGRPGPVWIEIPMDVQSAKINDELGQYIPEKNTKPAINKKDIEHLSTLLKNSQRPVIIAGQGIRIAGAIECFNEFVEKYGIPVVTPYLGIDVMKHKIGRAHV